MKRRHVLFLEFFLVTLWHEVGEDFYEDFCNGYIFLPESGHCTFLKAHLTLCSRIKLNDEEVCATLRHQSEFFAHCPLLAALPDLPGVRPMSWRRADLLIIDMMRQHNIIMQITWDVATTFNNYSWDWKFFSCIQGASAGHQLCSVELKLWISVSKSGESATFINTWLLRHTLHVYHVPEQGQLGNASRKERGSKVVCFYVLSTHHYCLF